ncbi:MAG: RNA methyltransferase [Cellulophaga sp.]|nr:RNA methyltransferase [Cellulophaga sp.]
MIDLKLLTYLENFITPERKERFIAVLNERTKLVTVAVEDVFQMHNASAVIRTCDVFGVQEAHIIEQRYGKRLDTAIAMGSQKWVDVHRHKNTADCMKGLKSSGYKIIATTPHKNTCLLNDFKIDGKTALFFGTERSGLSDEVLNEADGFLKIPMVGFTESLNVSVSAAIMLQTLMNSLKNSDLEWQLSAEEKLALRLDWTKKSVRSIDDVLKRYHQLS